VPALRKPYRIAAVLPQLSIEGSEAAYAAEGALLLWTACIEILRRHPGLAVYDAESTPLFPRDGHFAPQHAIRGATPTDEFFGPTRRDELVWLEVGLPKGKCALHGLLRSGVQQTFEGSGRTFGAQLSQAFTSWLAARGLPPLTVKLDAITGDDTVATIRVVGPGLVEHARKWTAVQQAPRVREEAEEIDAALDALVPTAERPKLVMPVLTRPNPARIIANRLPQPWRVPGLRVLELVFGEDFSEHLLAADASHPQALLATLEGKHDPALLRRVIAAAPGWAKPYTALLQTGELTALEKLAAAGIAALCRPGQLEVIEAAAARFSPDEAVRLMARALELYPHDSRAHVALLALYKHGDRLGAWSATAERAARRHGCSPDPSLPRYPDQLAVDVALSDALVAVGRRAEAVALRRSRGANPLPEDVHAVATAEARAAWFCGDVARALEAYGRAEPATDVDLALFLDTLVATGREEEAPLAWARLAPKPGRGAVARLAAARALMAAGEWRRGLEELWRVELGEPGRDDHVAIAHLGLLLSIMPLEIAEAALAERLGAGATSLARRMARDIGDFIPGAAKSTVMMRALGKPLNLDVDPDTLLGFSCPARTRTAIDALFVELEPDTEASERRNAAAGRRAARRGTKVDRPITVVIDPMVAADRLLDRWLEPVLLDGEAGVGAAALYVAAQALARYLASTTAVPTVNGGALRTVAAEALALVRVHRAALLDTDIQALLAALDPLLRKVDRWVGSRWLAAVERSCGIDERAAGDVAGFAARSATVAARILGPEETAVLAQSVASLSHDKPAGWEAAVAAQAARLALHTGHTGQVEWAEATVAQLASKAIDLDDAIDALHSACYLAEGSTAVPSAHLAKLLADAGRVPAAQAVLAAGLPAATKAQRTAALAAVADAWTVDLPLQPERAASELFEALQKRDPVRAEKLGRWAVACDPDNAEINRNLGLALAQQGKLVDALHHLTRGTREQATQILAGVLFQHGKLAEALAVLDHASRWYTSAEQWLGFGGIADATADRVRTERAYRRAYELDPSAFDPAQLETYSRACSGLGKHDEGVALAQQALERNKHSAVAALYRTTLEQAKERHPTTFVDSPLPVKLRVPAYVALDHGDFTTASAALTQRDWGARRAALVAVRYRTPAERSLTVTRRALAAASSMLVMSVGLMDRDAMLCRMMALAIREQSMFAHDPLPRLADQLAPPPKPTFVDRVVVPNSKIARISDYVSLLRDLAALSTREALQQFDLDDAGYLEVGKAWGAALAAEPALAAEIAAGLAKR